MFSARDTRTKEQKLSDMANQNASPREAEIARAKLATQRKHPMFRKRRDERLVGTADPRTERDLNDMPHEEFMTWLRREEEAIKPKVLIAGGR